jgi:hypothetical protein
VLWSHRLQECRPIDVCDSTEKGVGVASPAMRAELFEALARIGWLDVRRAGCCKFLHSLDHRARGSSRREYEVVPLWRSLMESSSTMMPL